MTFYAPYHAHIYFTLDELALAAQVRDAIAHAIPQLTYVGRLIPMPIGPHPKPMFEIHIPVEILASAIQTIDRLREGLSVLIHPVQHDELGCAHRRCKMVRHCVNAQPRHLARH
jgi:aromatic ring-cleaving dioxygenase